MDTWVTALLLRAFDSEVIEAEFLLETPEETLEACFAGFWEYKHAGFSIWNARKHRELISKLGLNKDARKAEEYEVLGLEIMKSWIPFC